MEERADTFCKCLKLDMSQEIETLGAKNENAS